MIINPREYVIDIPSFHPRDPDYTMFWEKELKTCITGKWISGLWVPPKLYFYANHSTILLNKNKSKYKVLGRPEIRDIEWLFHRLLVEARGFSGFSLDDTHTCLEVVREYQDDPEQTSLQELPPEAFSIDGSVKKYAPAREYLQRTFPRDMGEPEYLNPAHNIMMMGPRTFGKLTRPDEPIRIQNGWTTMAEIQVNDKVYGLDGNLATVTAKTPLQTNVEMFRVSFRDGRSAEVCGDHLWYVWSKNKADKRNSHSAYTVKSTLELFSDLKFRNEECKYAVPANSILLDETSSPVPIAPYTLGVLLGDGSITTTSVSISTADSQLIEHLALDSPEYTFRKRKSKYDYGVIGTSKGFIATKLKDLGLLGTNSFSKFIPDVYMYNSHAVRLAIIQGLMDTDGSVYKNGQVEYSTKSPKLKQQVADLLRSLGINCRVFTKRIDAEVYYRIAIFTNKPIFKLSRKLERLPAKATFKATKTSITNVEYIGKGEGYCISVDNPTHTYLINNYIPTHNSYLAGNIVAHEFLFDGKNTLNLTDENGKMLRPSTNIIVGAEESKYSSDLLSKTKTTFDNLLGGYSDGIISVPPPFKKKTKGVLTAGGDYVASYKKKVGNSWIDAGSMSSIKNRSFGDNPFAAVGNRCGIMIFEEIGFFRNLRATHSACVDIMKNDITKYGTGLYIGTGGSMERGTLESYYMYYHPAEFDLLSFSNEFENSTKEIALFIPDWMGLSEYKNENGVTNKDLAIKKLDKEREKLSKSSDPEALRQFIIFHPRTPSEMFSIRTNAVFPSAELQVRLSEVRSKNLMEKTQRKVTLYYDEKTPHGVNYSFDIENKLRAINEFPYKATDREGAVVIYDFPAVNEEGKVPKDLYIIGYDAFKANVEDGSSLAAIYVMKTTRYASKYGHNEIVASYVGRPYEGINSVNEILMKLSMFYGEALIYFENTAGNTVDYFEKHKKLYLLARQPNSILNNKASFETRSSIIYGYPMNNAKVKADAIAYLRSWLIETRGEDPQGNRIRNLDLITDEALLTELIQFSFTDGNFDRVMGLCGCVIGLEERYSKLKESLETEQENEFYKFIINNKNLFHEKHRNPSPKYQSTNFVL